MTSIFRTVTGADFGRLYPEPCHRRSGDRVLDHLGTHPHLAGELRVRTEPGPRRVREEARA